MSLVSLDVTGRDANRSSGHFNGTKWNRERYLDERRPPRGEEEKRTVAGCIANTRAIYHVYPGVKSIDPRRA